MRSIALPAIRVYQRHVSPYKGFCCAFGTHLGRASCSNLGFRAIRRYGIVVGVAVLKKRLFLCGVAYRRHGGAPTNRQRGSVAARRATFPVTGHVYRTVICPT